jgi:hypothetical protein
MAHFIPVRIAYTVDKLAGLYADNILRLHGALKIEDLSSQLSSGRAFTRPWVPPWITTQLSTLEKVNQILEDLLRACVLTYGSDWEKSLSSVEFSYNSSHQASLKMSPFEALYGRKFMTPLMWSEVGERQFFGLVKIKDAEEQVAKIRENLKMA